MSKRRSPWLCPAPSWGAGFFLTPFAARIYVEKGAARARNRHGSGGGDAYVGQALVPGVDGRLVRDDRWQAGPALEGPGRGEAEVAEAHGRGVGPGRRLADALHRPLPCHARGAFPPDPRADARGVRIA